MKEVQHTARAMMFRGNAPENDWPYAHNHAVYLHDVLPNAVTGMTPHEKRTGVAPRVSAKKMEGAMFCKCYAKLYRHGKMERDVIPCVYLGKDRRTPDILHCKKWMFYVELVFWVKFYLDL